MTMPEIKKRRLLLTLGFVLALLAAACGASEQPEPDLVQVPPMPTSSPAVEYGASLSEWEDVAEADAAVGTDVTNAENTAVAPPAPTSTDPAAATVSTDVATDNVAYQEILWDALVPANFTADAIMAKYQNQLDQIEDGSPEAAELWTQMQEEFNNAPVNATIDGMQVRLPGFIAPLDYSGDLITEFLLVPYFGACIHVPPPPVNQTVLVKTAEGQGIRLEDSYNPIWIMGELLTQRASTDLAEAGYYMENAIIEPYLP